MEGVIKGSVRSLGQIRAFQDVVLKMTLGDIGLEGGEFTWCNISEGNICTWEKLDQGLYSLAWRNLFPNATLHILSSSHSDHLPLLLKLKGGGVRVGGYG